MVLLTSPVRSSAAICCVGEVPQLEPLARRVQQRLRALGHFVIGRLAQLLLSAARNQVLLLGRHQVRAVEGEQRLPLVHQLAHKVGIDVFDPSRGLDVYVRDVALVGGYHAGGAQGAAHVLLIHRGQAHAERALLALRKVYQSGVGAWPARPESSTRTSAPGHPAVGRNAGLVRVIGRMHRVIPVENALLRLRGHGRSRRRRGALRGGRKMPCDLLAHQQEGDQRRGGQHCKDAECDADTWGHYCASGAQANGLSLDLARLALTPHEPYPVSPGSSSPTP